MSSSRASTAPASRSTSGSVSCATLLPRANRVTRTPRRASAWPSSSPMTPPPTTATDCGKSVHSNTASLVMTLSPAACHSGGTMGVEPVAITTLAASTSVCSSTCNVPGEIKRAWPRSFSSSGMALTPSSTKPTKRSRSLRTRLITCWPSMRTGPACTPKAGAAATAWAASAAAIKSLLGMQPTRAQVVPYGPLSIISTRLPCMRAALCAVMPAVPLPITATSTCIVFIVLSIPLRLLTAFDTTRLPKIRFYFAAIYVLV